jgi:hypothetical protein
MAGFEPLHMPESEEELAKMLDDVNIDPLPEIIVTNRHLHDITNQTIPALIAHNTPPQVFVRAGSLVRIGKDENGVAQINILSEAGLRGILSRCARYLERCRSDSVDSDPPVRVVKDIMTLPAWPGIPPVSCIITSPVIRADGSVITEPGYDPATWMFYIGSLELHVPESPTKADATKAAKYILDEVFSDFPFKDHASRANTLAALLTTITRPLIDGNTPLGLIDKPQAGTGASLLTEVIAEIATGAAACMQTAPDTDEEWRKAITAVLIQGPQIVVIDNVTRILRSAKLSQMLTARTWTDRMLSQSKMLNLPQTAAWFATGNNIQIGGDLARRSYWIRLDAAAARPWLRDGFKHQDLKAWVREHRSELLTSLVVMVRAWIVAERPKGTTPKIGSFEEWSTVIGGILTYAGVEGFLENAEELYDSADQEIGQWDLFLEQWQLLHRDDKITAAQLKIELTDIQSVYRPFQNEMPDEIIKATDRTVRGASVLGQTLRRHAGQVFPSGRKLNVDQDKHTKAMKWSVTTIKRSAEDQKSAESPPVAGKAEDAEDDLISKRISEFDENIHKVNSSSASSANVAPDSENAVLASSANVVIRVLYDIGEIVLLDGRTICLKREDVCSIPSVQARGLIEKGKVVEVYPGGEDNPSPTLGKVDRPTPARKEDPEITRIRAGHAAHQMRHDRHTCRLCEEHFEIPLTIWYHGGGYMCERCRRDGAPSEPIKADPQTVLADVQAT